MINSDSELFLGHGLQQAIGRVTTEIFPQLIGKIPSDQEKMDDLLISLDPDEKKSVYGANFLLSISKAIFYSGAADLYISPLDHILSLTENSYPEQLPQPIVTILQRNPKLSESLYIDEIRIYSTSCTSMKETMRVLNEVKEIIYTGLKEKDIDVILRIIS